MSERDSESTAKSSKDEMRPGVCPFCNERTDQFAGDPGMWPLEFAHPDGTGRVRQHHVKCVIARCFPVETTPAPLCTHKAEKVKRGYERGYDMAWCLECGGITWASDGWVGGQDAKRNDYTAWLNANLLASSCKAEAEGQKKCERWCGHHEFCPAALVVKTSSNQKGESNGDR